jgi:N-acyl-D-amino-acid deacylase
MSRLPDLLIKGGKVYDGTGGEAFIADIVVDNGRIVSISTDGRPYEGKTRDVIDAGGLCVAPGFIDAHSHSEFTLLADNRAEGKILQGITTEINGNCGLSAAPLLGEAKEHREGDLLELGIKERWSTFGEYFRSLERRGVALNFATLVGHGNIRASVIGYGNRTPDKEDMGRMLSLTEDAVSEGAIGLSTGLIYPPGVYAETGEIIGLARSIKDRIYTSHMRSEGDELIEAIEETVKIGRESGIRVHISHLKTGGKSNWGKIEKAVSTIESAREEGISVTCDRYPYIASSTDLDAVLPPWTYAGGAEEELRRLRDPGVRADLRSELLSQGRIDDYWNGIMIASVQTVSNKWMEGKKLLEAAKEVKRDPVDFLFDVLVQEKLRIGAIFFSMNEDNLVSLLPLHYLMIGSDSSARSMDGPTRQGKPHPRTFGTFPRFLGRYARDRKLMSLGRAIHKMTLLTAKTFALEDRGCIKTGFWADLVIFDEDGIRDCATFEDPFQKPEGIPHVIVNGSRAVRDGAPTGALAGKVLRHGR